MFITIFLALSGAPTFFMGRFLIAVRRFEFLLSFHPWIYLFLIPAVAAPLGGGTKTGTVELLLTLPMPTWQIVIGKYMAAWIFVAIALALTFPLWITVNWLGDPDNGVIVASYIGSFVMAGGYLAIGSCISAFTKNQ